MPNRRHRCLPLPLPLPPSPSCLCNSGLALVSGLWWNAHRRLESRRYAFLEIHGEVSKPRRLQVKERSSVTGKRVWTLAKATLQTNVLHVIIGETQKVPCSRVGRGLLDISTPEISVEGRNDSDSCLHKGCIMNDTGDSSPTFRTLVTSFTDFITVAIHTILYERCIYPQTSFLTARKYNFPVRQSRHPKVCEWINDAVNAIEAELLRSTVEKIAVVVYTEQNLPVERFLFDVSRFPDVPIAEIDVPLDCLAADGSDTDVLPIVDLEEQLRATMSRLSNCSSGLGDLPKGCSFTIVMELKPDGEAPVDHPQRWIPAEKAQNNPTSADPDKLSNKLTTPVRTVSAGEMVFEAWIEQLGTKLDHLPITPGVFDQSR